MRSVRMALAVILMALVLVLLLWFLAVNAGRPRKPFLWDSREHPTVIPYPHSLKDL